MVVAFRLRRQFTLRGHFVPWPVPGVAVGKSSVLATTKSPHDRGNRKLEFRGVIGSDGRFELPAPVCPSCVLELDVGGQPFWSAELDTNEERREFDVGDVALLPAATLTGQFDAPDAEVRAQIVVSVTVATPEGENLHVEGSLEADGSFHVAPLPQGAVSVAFRIGHTVVATLADASGLSGEDRSIGLATLASGTTVDVGTVTTQETVLFGTVRDAEGRPVAQARINEDVRLESQRYYGVFGASSDGAGRFAGLRTRSRLEEMGEDLARSLRNRANWEVSVAGRMSGRFEVEWSEGSRWIRHDVVLDEGFPLRGILLDAAGAPISGASLSVSTGTGPVTRFGSDTTRIDGSFEIRGLSAGAYHVFVFDGSGPLHFEDIHPENGPVTLRPSDAKKQ